MKYSEISLRYAKALYLLAKEEGAEDKAYSELQGLAAVIEKDPEITRFVCSPLVKNEDKERAFLECINQESLSKTVQNFVTLLAKKGRIQLVPEMLLAYQELIDESHGVTRGTVRSATALTEDQRKKLEDSVSKHTAKKVILTYKEDSNLLGGLVAEVGSFRFDDTLTTHLTRLNEELNRSAQ